MKKVIKKKAIVAKKPVKKFEDGGKKKSKSYQERDYTKSKINDGRVIEVESADGKYSKAIREFADGSGYLMVRKDGKMNQFNLPKGEFEKQKKIAKKEAGYKNGGTVGAKKKTVAKKKK